MGRAGLGIHLNRPMSVAGQEVQEVSVSTFYSATQLTNHQRKRARRVRRSLTVEHDALVQRMRQEAVKLTFGTVSLEEQKRLDHPYARRHGTPKLPRLPIHRHTGRLQRSLRVFKRILSGGLAIGVGSQTWTLQFTAPYSKFVLAPGGTKKMLARGFWTEMRKRYNAQKRRLLDAKRKAEAI